MCAVGRTQPAYRASLEKGDLFIELNGRNAGRIGLFEVPGSLQRWGMDVRCPA